MQERGELGCFSLTEKLAGVNSGLVVNTTATWDPAAQGFILHTPNEGARKNWISQGLVADKTVVVADLRLDGKSLGPHAFLTDLRVGGRVVPGVSHGDMGRKTVGNDLDNAWIAFDGVRLPRTALLNRYADIEDGKYVQKVKGIPVFHMIGQRLFSGSPGPPGPPGPPLSSESVCRTSRH
jgi:acyl-CoA oxidase